MSGTHKLLGNIGLADGYVLKGIQLGFWHVFWKAVGAGATPPDRHSQCAEPGTEALPPSYAGQGNELNQSGKRAVVG